MLVLPTDNIELPCIIGIDPGSTTLGLAVIYFDPRTCVITRCDAMTVSVGNVPHPTGWYERQHGASYVRLRALRAILLQYFNYYKPVIIGAESPFYNPRRPNAYGILVETLNMIRSAVVEHSVWLSPELVDPPSVKKAIGAPGNADKDVVRKHLNLLTEVTSTLPMDLSNYDEHSIDALAVAYKCFNDRRASGWLI